MSNELKTTFSDLTPVAFRAYASNLCEGYPRAPERQRLQAYMFQTIASDRAVTRTEQNVLNTKRTRHRDHQNILEDLVLQHAHDYTRADELFVEQTKTDAEILALLTIDDAEVFIRDRNITGNVLLSGDKVKFGGLGSTGTAAAEPWRTRASSRGGS